MVRKRSYCTECRDFKPEEQYGDCERRKWGISMELAKHDKVCSYDSFKDKFFGEDESQKRDNLEAWKGG